MRLSHVACEMKILINKDKTHAGFNFSLSTLRFTPKLTGEHFQRGNRNTLKHFCPSSSYLMLLIPIYSTVSTWFYLYFPLN